MRVLTEMMGRGICLNVVTFNTWIDALCKEGMITEAHKLLDVMTQSGVEPEVITHTTLMDGDMV